MEKLEFQENTPRELYLSSNTRLDYDQISVPLAGVAEFFP
jgi:hypothetical protein